MDGNRALIFFHLFLVLINQLNGKEETQHATKGKGIWMEGALQITLKEAKAVIKDQPKRWGGCGGSRRGGGQEQGGEPGSPITWSCATLHSLGHRRLACQSQAPRWYQDFMLIWG